MREVFIRVWVFYRVHAGSDGRHDRARAGGGDNFRGGGGMTLHV